MVFDNKHSPDSIPYGTNVWKYYRNPGCKRKISSAKEQGELYDPGFQGISLVWNGEWTLQV